MCYERNKYFWRQAFVVSSSIFQSAGIAFVLTFPAVLNPTILDPNTDDIRATPGEASWIAAANGISGMFGFILNSYVMDKFGRRIDFILLNVTLIISWITFYFAKSIAVLIIARTIQGIACGGLFINALIISEYSHPSRRGYFTSIKKCMGAVGTLICHSLTLSFSWRAISCVAMIPSILSLLITLFWPESPAHLASKGLFGDCERSFKWLHGTSARSEKELKDMITAQVQKREVKTDGVFKQIKDKSFLKSFFVVSLITIVLDASGKYYFVAYIIQMLIEITGDKSVATYCSLGGDGLSIIALFLSCFVIKAFNRRTLLFSFGSLSVLLMLSIGFIQALLPDVVWLIPTLMLMHFFVVNLSVIPLCFTLFGELFPINVRAIGSCLSGIILTFFYAVTMKLTPILMEFTGVGGTYATYGLVVLICLVLLYYYLPETKDKTLQEIEEEFCGSFKVIETAPML